MTYGITGEFVDVVAVPNGIRSNLHGPLCTPSDEKTVQRVRVRNRMQYTNAL